MKEALKEARKAYKKDEVPVGAVIVKDGEIIARAHNVKEQKKDTTKHAEIIAIQKASKKLESWRLENCTMYVTLEPCAMCTGAMIQARLKKVVIGTMDEKTGACGSVLNLLEDYKFNHVVEIEKGKDFIFTATVAVKPEVTLGDYKGIEVEKKTVKVMAADVNAEIDKVREQNSRMITVENRGIKKDDTAVIDFEGFVDGEPFQGGKGEDYSLVIGSHSFIDTFEDQLVGKKAGEEVDVNVTFPEEYHEASLKGKPALFKVTVKEIKKKELPKLDDEFASEVSEFETLKEYKASVKKNLTERRKEEAKREKENEVVEKVVENITVELPEPMVDEQTQQMIQEFAGRLSSQGLSFDQYMQMTGMTVDALMGQMKPEAEKRIRTRLALEAIVDAEKIKATAKDIDKEIENMANMYQMEVDKIKEMIGDAEKEQIGKDLAVQKAVDFVVKNAVEVEPAEEDKEEK